MRATTRPDTTRLSDGGRELRDALASDALFGVGVLDEVGEERKQMDGERLMSGAWRNAAVESAARELAQIALE